MDSFDKEDLNDTQSQNDIDDIDNSAGSCMYDLSQPLILEETESFNETGENDENRAVTEDSTETFDKNPESEPVKLVEVSETIIESQQEVIISSPNDGSFVTGETKQIPDTDKPMSNSKNDIFDKETEIETLGDEETERVSDSEKTCDFDDSEEIIESSQSQSIISQISETSLLRKRKMDEDISQSPKKISKTETDPVKPGENSLPQKPVQSPHPEDKDRAESVEDKNSLPEKNTEEGDIKKPNETPDINKEQPMDVSDIVEETRNETTDPSELNTNQVSDNPATDVSTKIIANIDIENTVSLDQDASDLSKIQNDGSPKTLDKADSDTSERDNTTNMDVSDSKTAVVSQETSEDKLKNLDEQDQKENQIDSKLEDANAEDIQTDETIKVIEDDRSIEVVAENKDEVSTVKIETSSVDNKIEEVAAKNIQSDEADREEKPKVIDTEFNEIQEAPKTCSSPNNMKSLNSSYETSLVTKVCSTPQSDGENAVQNHENLNFDSIKSHNASDLDTSEKAQSSVRRRMFYVEIEYSMHQNEQNKDLVQKEISQVICHDVSDVHKHSCANSDLSSGVLGDISKSISPSSITTGSTSSAQNRHSTLSNASRLSTLSRYSTSSTVSCVSSISSVPSLGISRSENFILPSVPISKSKEKSLNQYQNLSTEQIDTIKTQWNNTEQLLRILNFIDHTPYSYAESPNDRDILSLIIQDRTSINFNNAEAKSTDKSGSEETLKTIKEVVTPRSTKKRASGNRKLNQSSDVNQNIAAIENSTEHKLTKSAKKTKRTPSVNSTPSSGHDKQTTPERNLPPGDSNFSVGLPVFARWTDRKYYSGTIDAYIKEGKWSVKFDDGNKKTLIEEFILKNCHTLLKGHSVYAIVGDDGEYDSGIVATIITREKTIRYEVEIDKGTKVTVTAQQLFLTEDQAKSIRETIAVTPPSTPKRMGVVSLDNIVDGKRMTRSKHQRTPTASPKPGVSGTRKRIELNDLRNSVIEEVGGVEIEFKADTPTKSSKGPGRVKGLLKPDKRSARSKLRETIDESLLGPIPDEGSTLFAGLSFLLNCAKPIVRKEKSAVEKTNSTGTSNESGTETESESMDFSKVPFIEEHLYSQIIAGGGKVYKHFEDVPTEDYENLKLVSNRPNKTAKYIQCMAEGIMILSHEWIVNCCKQNQRRMFQELPYGWSVEQNCFVDSFKRPSNKPLKDLLVMIAPNKDGRFVKFWKRICESAGGTVQVMESADDDFQTATFVLADNECLEKIVDKALAWDIPLLSTHWIVQSIIHGEARPFNGNEQYSYEFVESD